MSNDVDHPDIDQVVYPLHLDGTLAGAQPRMRHRPDCGHFKWPDSRFLGIAKPATHDQLRDLPACKSCLKRRRTPTD